MSDPATDGALEELLAWLTLEQKAAQLTGLSVMELTDRKKPIVEGKGPETDPSRLAQLRPHGVGHLCMAWFLGHDADSLRSEVADVQAAMRDVSPFGIGALIHNEAVNEFMHTSGTQFPTAWAQAATWQPDLVRRAAAVSAGHLRDAGMQLAHSRVMDLVRDPRWGRVHESSGEDPELVARFSVAFVSGMQGADGATGVLATGKHFLGYGSVDSLYQFMMTPSPASLMARRNGRSAPPYQIGGGGAENFGMSPTRALATRATPGHARAKPWSSSMYATRTPRSARYANCWTSHGSASRPARRARFPSRFLWHDSTTRFPTAAVDSKRVSATVWGPSSPSNGERSRALECRRGAHSLRGVHLGIVSGPKTSHLCEGVSRAPVVMPLMERSSC